MPRSDRPLSRIEIASVLRNIADHPPNIPAGVALDAMVVTAHHLLGASPGTDIGLPEWRHLVSRCVAPSADLQPVSL
jgi:hypothetical protein